MSKGEKVVSKTRVLFNWKPRVLDYSLKGRFRRRMAAAGFASLDCLIEVRDPEYAAQNTPTYWHQDAAGSRMMIAVWANVRPTEFRFADGSLLQARDGDVILFDNDEVMHKAPDDQTGRWFIRTSVAEVGDDHSITL